MIRDLTVITDAELRNLRPHFDGSTLHVGAHPAWHLFFISQPGDIPELKINDGEFAVRRYVDKQIDSAVDLQREAIQSDNVPFVNFNNLQYLVTDGVSPESIRKTNSYLSALAEFFKAYEVLRETAYYTALRESGLPTVIILPKDYQKTTLYPASFAAHLDYLTLGSPFFMYLESEGVNTGRIHTFNSPAIEKGTRADVPDPRKLDAMERLYGALGIEGVNLFGGQINFCLRTTQTSLMLCSISNVVFLLDVSVCNPDDIQYTLIKAGSPYADVMGAERYAAFSRCVNDILQQPADFSGLKRAIGKDPFEQLMFFEQFREITEKFHLLKEAFAYNHPRHARSTLLNQVIS